MHSASGRMLQAGSLCSPDSSLVLRRPSFYFEVLEVSLFKVSHLQF